MTEIVLFTRDLRLSDHPALTAASHQATALLPVFVLDEHLLRRSPRRTEFLWSTLTSLRAELRARGSDLWVAKGDLGEILRDLSQQVSAKRIHLTIDYSAYARNRLAKLQSLKVEICQHPGHAVVEPGDLLPVGGDHYKVFTPYWNRWHKAEWRSVLRTPRLPPLPVGLRIGKLPQLAARQLPAELASAAAERVLQRWMQRGVRSYASSRDRLTQAQRSGLSVYFRFGVLSPLRVAWRMRAKHAASDWLRQLAWRDFFYQVLAAVPDLGHRDYRRPNRPWPTSDPSAAIAAWREGHTGHPLIDAAMRELNATGHMHNRLRMLVASYLTKRCGVPWQFGFQHFDRHLLDGDVGNNAGNWQWCAGTGNDTRPNRVLSPVAQAKRFDADGAYVKRWLPELTDVPKRFLHEPWRWPLAGWPTPMEFRDLG